MSAISVRHRPGVMVWYFDGAFAWSENDPSVNGQGKGYLLALDANPNELALPGLTAYLKGDAARYDTRYELGDPKAQQMIADAWFTTQCFVRNQALRPLDLATLAPGKRCPGDVAPVGKLTHEGKPFLYVYEMINTLLPGAARERVTETGELYDYRMRDGKVVWRLRDRSLRYLHNADSPFALERFGDQIVTWDVVDGALKKVSSVAAPAVAGFTDATPARWANPKLFFGGVAVPDAGLAFELVRPKADAPKSARVKLYFTWGQ
jgi:hypothetical protein